MAAEEPVHVFKNGVAAPTTRADGSSYANKVQQQRALAGSKQMQASNLRVTFKVTGPGLSKAHTMVATTVNGTTPNYRLNVTTRRTALSSMPSARTRKRCSSRCQPT